MDKKGPVLIETNARPIGLAMTQAYLDEALYKTIEKGVILQREAHASAGRGEFRPSRQIGNEVVVDTQQYIYYSKFN